MNKTDEELLKQYLKDSRKKKLLFLIIAIFIILSASFYGYCTYYKKPSQDIENYINEVTDNNIINEITENTTKEETTLNQTENTIVKETQEETENKVVETKENDTEKVSKQEIPKQETQEKSKENTQTTEIKENTNPKVKPSNKDFLFSDGYNMDNVTQAAEGYLKSHNWSGECIPIKDDEGVYLGMRVIFY